MIKINCKKCNNELNKPGGLYFLSPNEYEQTNEWHICKDCELKLILWIADNTKK